MAEKPNFNSITNVAADHVRTEKMKNEISELKRHIFSESNAAENSFNKILEKMPDDLAEKLSLDLENLLYAIGRIRAYTTN